jgi:hypothetical protein
MGVGHEKLLGKTKDVNYKEVPWHFCTLEPGQTILRSLKWQNR